jgi:hypothetical protein
MVPPFEYLATVVRSAFLLTGANGHLVFVFASGSFAGVRP